MVHFIHLMPLCILDNMAKQPMSISDEDYKKVNEAIDAVKEDGKSIRSIFESYYEEEVDIDWEVDAAVDAFSIFSSRWTVEILATLYIAGDRRFNELRKLLRGSHPGPSRTSSPSAWRPGWSTGSWRPHRR